MNDWKTLSLGLVVALTSGACAHVSLKNRPVRDIHVELAYDGGVCPGQEVPLAVTARLADGTEVVTAGLGQGRGSWKNYDVQVDPGLAKKGTIHIAEDPRDTWRQPVTVTVRSVHQPALERRFSLPIRYDCDYHARFSGSDGTSGFGGTDGQRGDEGKPGGHGRRGRRGEPGAHGAPVQAWLTLVQSNEQRPIAQVRIVGDGREHFYAFDPAHGGLTIDTHGGAGGAGGRGGDGGTGGEGDTLDKVPRGDGGDGGDGGRGGSGGDGGDATLYVDPAAEALVERVHVLAHGGEGGHGGGSGSGGSVAALGPGNPSGGRSGSSGESGRHGRPGAVRISVVPVARMW
jgi:hypothetical protein